MNMGKLVGIAVVVLALSGCGAAGAGEAARSVAPEVVASAEASVEPTEAPAAAPVVIEPTAAADASANFNGYGSQREWYLRTLDDALSGVPSDDALISAGVLACEELTAGTPRDAVRVVEGGTDQDNQNIVGAAVQVYCPEFT